MKIGIYGDSYTTPTGFHDQPTNWYNKLASLLSDTHGVPVDINHYGLAGSSLYYSYKKFFTTHHRNDLNIILITGPNRFPFTVQFSTPGHVRAFTNKEHVLGTIDTLSGQMTDDDLKKLNSIVGWFDACFDEQYFNDVAELMVDKLSTVSNTIVYPCFSDSFSPAQFEKHGLDKVVHYMHSLWVRQCELLKINPNGFTAVEKETLCGHLSTEFNVFFANILFKKIKTGSWDHSGFFDVTINHPRDFYYENFNHE